VPGAPSLTDQRGTDPDTTRLIALLQGASRGPYDPDVKLALTLPELEGTDDAQAMIQALECLARDAHPH